MFRNLLTSSREVIRSISMESKAISVSNVYAISDLHVDYVANRKCVASWWYQDYASSALIVAGDITDDLSLLEETLKSLVAKFKVVLFVPGNHELWLRGEENHSYLKSSNSLEKFNLIKELCDNINVNMSEPLKVCRNDSPSSTEAWLVPLFSWYSKPQEDPLDSLYIEPPSPELVEDVDWMEAAWMDNRLCKWPQSPSVGAFSPSKTFADMNKTSVSRTYDAPVISFSHFVPRSDLIRADAEDVSRVNEERVDLGLGPAPAFQGGTPGFNFTRYAGSKSLEMQIRKLGSTLHVYGHQHRNRDRVVDGVRYVSHCLGNPREQKEGWTWGVRKWQGPKPIWP